MHWDERNKGEHGALRALYKELLRLRREVPALASLDMQGLRTVASENCGVFLVSRPHERGDAVVALHFGAEPARVSFPFARGMWSKLTDSAEERWSGPGSPAPATIDSQGEASLALSPKSLVAYAKS